MSLQGRCLSTLGAACGLNGSACRLCQRRTATDAELISQPLLLCITISLLNCRQAVVGGAGLGSEQQPQQATEPSQQGQQGAPLIVRGKCVDLGCCLRCSWLAEMHIADKRLVPLSVYDPDTVTLIGHDCPNADFTGSRPSSTNKRHTCPLSPSSLDNVHDSGNDITSRTAQSLACLEVA